MTVRAYIALGSNLGDREKNINKAVAILRRHPWILVGRMSALYETEPVGMSEGEASPWFLNAVVEVDTKLAARELLDVCLQVEQRLGRNRDLEDKGQGYLSRTLDMDLLLYGDRVFRETGLEIPHPRLHQRAFVLVPLAELASGYRHPLLDKTIAELKDGFNGAEICRPFQNPVKSGKSRA